MAVATGVVANPLNATALSTVLDMSTQYRSATITQSPQGLPMTSRPTFAARNEVIDRFFLAKIVDQCTSQSFAVGQHPSHITLRRSDDERTLGTVEVAESFAQTYFHGTKADLKLGDLIEAGYNSNFGQRKNAKYIFLAATLDPAIWGAELAVGEGRERIYLVEPTGQIENDPDLTDKKFPGNPTMSYRSTEPFRVVGEVTVWQGHTVEQVQGMKDALQRLKEQGINSLNDE